MLRVGVLAALIVTLASIDRPRPAHADALPGDVNDIYFHCTAAEQCPDGASQVCPALRGPAGRRDAEPTCAAEANGKALAQKCYGRAGFLFCPGSVNAAPSNSSAAPPTPKPPARRGCS